MSAPALVDRHPNSASQRLMFTSNGTFLHHIAWSPPQDHSWKLNFAGHVADEELGIAGAAFVIRNEDAIFKTCFATPLRYVQNIVVAELVALVNGLEAAIRLGIEFLEIEGDCSYLFYLLGGLVSALSPVIEDLVDDCLNLFHGFRSLTFSCVSIFSNQAANKLAVIAVPEEEPLHWSEPPNAISGLLIEDVIGRWLRISDI